MSTGRAACAQYKVSLSVGLMRNLMTVSQCNISLGDVAFWADHVTVLSMMIECMCLKLNICRFHISSIHAFVHLFCHNYAICVGIIHYQKPRLCHCAFCILYLQHAQRNNNMPSNPSSSLGRCQRSTFRRSDCFFWIILSNCKRYVPLIRYAVNELFSWHLVWLRFDRFSAIALAVTYTETP